MISFPWKDVAGREDRTHDRLHTRQMRVRPSCHARLWPSKNSLCLSCIIPGHYSNHSSRWDESEGSPRGTTRLFTSRTIFSSQTNLPASVSWYTAFVNLSYELKMKSVKIILGGSWGKSPPEAKSYSFLTVLPTTYVLFRYFAFASMCYSLLPIMLNIFDVICQLADDFYEKKYIYFSTF